jgi:ribosomal protein S18 acetylase RimI-like enzyme
MMNPILRPATDTDCAFAFEVKKDAMGEHIVSRWGWDEEYQLNIHKQRWSEKPWFIVILGAESIGTVSIHDRPDFIRFGEFYLLNDFRRKGLGSMILSKFLKSCDRSNREVRLEYLKWNPVGSLYKRHGFEVVSENEIHYFMVRKPR